MTSPNPSRSYQRLQVEVCNAVGYSTAGLCTYVRKKRLKRIVKYEQNKDSYSGKLLQSFDCTRSEKLAQNCSTIAHCNDQMFELHTYLFPSNKKQSSICQGWNTLIELQHCYIQASLSCNRSTALQQRRRVFDPRRCPIFSSVFPDFNHTGWNRQRTHACTYSSNRFIDPEQTNIFPLDFVFNTEQAEYILQGEQDEWSEQKTSFIGSDKEREYPTFMPRVHPKKYNTSKGHRVKEEPKINYGCPKVKTKA